MWLHRDLGSSQLWSGLPLHVTFFMFSMINMESDISMLDLLLCSKSCDWSIYGIMHGCTCESMWKSKTCNGVVVKVCRILCQTVATTRCTWSTICWISSPTVNIQRQMPYFFRSDKLVAVSWVLHLFWSIIYYWCIYIEDCPILVNFVASNSLITKFWLHQLQSR